MYIPRRGERGFRTLMAVLFKGSDSSVGERSKRVPQRDTPIRRKAAQSAVPRPGPQSTAHIINSNTKNNVCR